MLKNSLSLSLPLLLLCAVVSHAEHFQSAPVIFFFFFFVLVVFLWSEAAAKHLHTDCSVTQTLDARGPKEHRCYVAWRLTGGGETVHRGHGSLQHGTMSQKKITNASD